MLQDLLYGLFMRFNLQRGSAAAGEAVPGGSCGLDLSGAVEHVVDQISGRLRTIPGYRRRLSGPVAATFEHIDRVAEAVPGPIFCRRSAFSEDPRVNAFFVSPQHLQEVFSQSEEVRRLFAEDPLATECWTLLCLRTEERRRPGMALVDGEPRKDVMQTSISFTDHQLVSPGADEASARCALKCCMFNGLLNHLRQRSKDARTRVAEMEHRLRVQQRRLRELRSRHAEAEALRAVELRIASLEKELANEPLRLSTVGDQLDYVVEALARPADYISAERSRIRVNRLGVKLEEDAAEPGHELELVEIRSGSGPRRVATLARFPRDELLPEPDFLRQADLFLAI